VNEFFAIDVASEIRSLCDAQLRGTWQMPAELVRYAIRSGATKVAIASRRRGFTVSWKGGPLRLSTLDSLTVALDDTAKSGVRQQAIADLESSGAEALLWAGGVAGARLHIKSVANGQRVTFSRRAGRPPRLRSSAQPAASDQVALRWGCAKLDRRRAELWLNLACRFAGAEITLNGRPAARGFSGGLYRTRLEQPVPCTIGLTRHGEEPVLWLLREGIVAARAVLPGYPPFEAAVELGSVVTGPAASSDLRRAVVPFVPELCERAVGMMIEVAGRPRRLSGAPGQRLVALLLRAARRDLRAREIRSLPLFATPSGDGKPLSLAQLERMATQGRGRLFAVEPGDDGAGLLADAAATVVASPEVRGLLTELTGIRCHQPPRQRLRWWRRLVDGVRARGRRTVERCRGILAPRAVQEEALTVGERRLLALLRAALSPRTVDLGGGGGLRRTSSGLVLPRFDPAVVATVALVEEDPAWLYPLVLALRLGPPALGSLQQDWRNWVGTRPA
jgi:hypothetical protein